MSYYDIYKKRLNRYGNDVQGRIQGQRERVFDEYVKTSLNRVSFEMKACQGANIDKVKIYSVLERNKQDYVETTGYLLVPFTVTIQISPEETQTFNVEEEFKLAPGTILDILSLNGTHTYWMVWWKEKIESSGYNKYTILQMTNEITWYHDGIAYTQRFFVKGPGRSMINDTIKSSSTGAVYAENDNKYALVSTLTKNLAKEDYFEISINGVTNAFIVAEVDSTSTPGVGYYTLDASFKRKENEQVDRTIQAVDGVHKQWLTGGDN